MRKRAGSRTLILVLLLILFVLAVIQPHITFSSDLSEIEKIIGAPGQMLEGALVFSFPRTDIQVQIDGEPMPAALGFGSWTTWKNMGDRFMVMGDLVLLEKEINPVISALAEININVTGLHNHFLREQPRIMYLHIEGMGLAPAMAKGIRNALDKTSTPKASPSTLTASPALAIDTKRIEEIIGHPGRAAGVVFKITIGRQGVKMRGIELTASTGLNTWAAFAGTNERAHVAGDVAMTAPEVNRVIRALQRGGIDIVAVHNHMLIEEPRIFFLHYLGTGPAEKLARTVREAFDEVKGPLQ